MHDDLLDVAVDAARRAGALLLGGRGTARLIETKSSATDMVSELDRASEALIRSVITERRPDDAILGEEGGLAGGRTAVHWVVDPLDGTTNYLYDFPAWAVSVAAETEDGPVAGAVYDPLHDELWAATEGGGASLNGHRLAPVAEVPLATALVATGFAYKADRRESQGRVAAQVLPRVRDLRRAGSAALDLCWVAGGRVNAYFEQYTNRWDWAAGALVAREAGAWVGGYDGGAPGPDGIVAAPPGLAADLRALLTTSSRT